MADKILFRGSIHAFVRVIIWKESYIVDQLFRLYSLKRTSTSLATMWKNWLMEINTLKAFPCEIHFSAP